MGWKDKVNVVGEGGTVVETAQQPQQDTESVTDYNKYIQGARQAAQGLTFGTGEEIEAGVRSIFSPRSYKDIRDELRTKQQLFESDNPALAAGLEIGGAVAVPFGGLLRGANIAGRALKAGDVGTKIQRGLTSEKAATRIGTGAGVGAAGGATYGAGKAEEISDIPEKALEYGTLGAVGGAIVPEAIKVTGKFGGSLFKNVKERFGTPSIDAANANATKVLADKLEKDNLTTDDVRTMFKEYEKLGVDNATLADLGKNLQDAGFVSYSVPSKGKTETARFLEGRAEELKGETFRNISKNANIDTERLGIDFVNDLADKQKTLARQNYPEAYSKAVPAQPFRKYADRDLFNKAYREAQELADIEGVQLPPLSKLYDADFVETDTLHQIKRGLDGIIEQGTDITGGMTVKAGAVSKVKREFNDLIKKYNPEYAKAQKEFKDDIDLRNAYDFGSKYLNKDFREIRNRFKDATPAEKQSFRVGMMSAIEKQMQNMKGVDLSAQVFKSDKQREALRFVFDDPKAYKRFKDSVEKQQKLLETNRAVMGGSQTKARDIVTEETKDTMAQIAETALTGRGMLPAAMDFVRSGIGRIQYGPETLEQLQRKLFSKDPKVVEQTLLDIEQMRQRSQQGLLSAERPSALRSGTIPTLLTAEEEMPTIDIVGGQYPR